MNVIAHFEEVESGAAYLGRGKLQSALELIEEGKAGAIIFYALDRFSRDTEHQEVIKKRIHKAGGKLIFCTQNFEDTEEGDLMMGVSGQFNAYFRKLVRRGCINGHRGLLKEGITPVRTLRNYGYEIIKSRDPKGRKAGTFEIIESEAAVVRKMFAMYAEGKTLGDLLEYLEAEKTPTVRGGIWRSGTLSKMLRNTIYKGKFSYGKHKRMYDEKRIENGLNGYYLARQNEGIIYIDVPAIVNETLFDAVQKRITTNTGTGGGRNKKYMLTGLLKCAGCGLKLTAFKAINRRKASYRCHHYGTAKGKLKKCTYDVTFFQAHLLESQVIETIIDVTSNKVDIKVAYDLYLDEKKQSNKTSEADKLRKELAKLKKRERVLIESQIKAKLAGTNTATYDEMIAATSSRRGVIENQLSSLEVALPTHEAMVAPLSQFTTESIEAIKVALNSPGISNHDKNMIVSGIVHHVIPINKTKCKVYFYSEKGFYVVATWDNGVISTAIETV